MRASCQRGFSVLFIIISICVILSAIFYTNIWFSRLSYGLAVYPWDSGFGANIQPKTLNNTKYIVYKFQDQDGKFKFFKTDIQTDDNVELPLSNQQITFESRLNNAIDGFWDGDRFLEYTYYSPPNSDLLIRYNYQVIEVANLVNPSKFKRIADSKGGPAIEDLYFDDESSKIVFSLVSYAKFEGYSRIITIDPNGKNIEEIHNRFRRLVDLSDGNIYFTDFDDNVHSLNLKTRQLKDEGFRWFVSFDEDGSEKRGIFDFKNNLVYSYTEKSVEQSYIKFPGYITDSEGVIISTGDQKTIYGDYIFGTENIVPKSLLLAPNSNKVFFTTTSAGKNKTFIYDRETSDNQLLINPQEYPNLSARSISPDEKYILFLDNDAKIFIFNTNTSKLKEFQSPGKSIEFVSWLAI